MAEANSAAAKSLRTITGRAASMNASARALKASLVNNGTRTLASA